MGKEQELRPEALEAARAEFFSPNQLQSTKLERAIAAYLSAASDEQAEVVACPDCGGNGHIAIDVSHPECCGQFGKSGECCGNAVEGRHQEAMPCQRCLGLGWFTASPPAVAAGGVTEERLEAGAKALCLATGLDWDSIPETAEGDDKDTGPETRRYFRQWFKPALTAALAVGDEGIREGWQPIDTAPPAMHVTACRFDHDAGEWVYAVVMSPPVYPFTHWRMLDAPPSRGEGV